jgi:hypothetical protein
VLVGVAVSVGVLLGVFVGVGVIGTGIQVMLAVAEIVPTDATIASSPAAAPT